MSQMSQGLGRRLVVSSKDENSIYGVFMNSFRRLTSSITSSFQWMISQVENHEALVNAALKEVQEARARANVQLKKVRQDGLAMRKNIEELRKNNESWRERAIKTAESDQKKALECVKRQKRAERELHEAEEQEREHARFEKQLLQDLVTIDDKLSKLTQQRNLLRTRQSRAEALRTLQVDDSHLIGELDEIFERWETKVTGYEFEGSCAAPLVDDFEAEFSNADEEAELSAALQAMIEQAKGPIVQPPRHNED